jgi:hypothetical protein
MVTGIENSIEIRPHERFTAAEINLKDAGLVQLLNQIKRFGRSHFIFGRFARGGKAVTATKIAGQ